MAGPNQHYIPSFLQRAFGIRPRRREIWYFSRSEAAERRLIKRTASEDFFYSKVRADGRLTLDDAITRIESDLAVWLRDIRSKSPGDVIAAKVAAAIVFHLAQRTAHFRAMFSEGMARVLERAEESFAERDSVEALMGTDNVVPTDRFRELATSELASNPEVAQFNIPLRVLERIAFLLAKENVAEMVGFASVVLDWWRPQATEFVRDSHNQGLGRAVDSSESEYEAFLRTFDWTVEQAPATGAILPDCVVVAVGSKGKAGNHMLIGRDKLRALLLAVSPQRLLVGCKPGFALPDDFDYNFEAACLSHTFFLAPRNDDDASRLCATIGQKLGPTLAEAVDCGFEEVVAGESGDMTGDEVSGIEALGWKPTSACRYELLLEGCGDEHTLVRVRDAVVALVAELAGVMPLERLDGITIGSDYPALLRTVKRGWDSAPMPETVPPEVGIGVAQTVTVKRSGMVKGRIVVSSIVSDALIAEDAEQKAWGAYVLVRRLAAVALMEIVEGRLPGTLLGLPGDGIDGWLRVNLGGAPESYSASWMAAAFGHSEEIAAGRRELLAEGIDRMITVVPQERLAYREHGDLDRLLGVALPTIQHVLIVGADLLGHCAFTGEDPLGSTSDLGDALDRAGLRKWFRVYGDDLARFHQRLGRWASFEEFLAFNIHAERLLLAVGMFIWDSPEGVRVEVPLGADAEALGSGAPRTIGGYD